MAVIVEADQKDDDVGGGGGPAVFFGQHPCPQTVARSFIVPDHGAVVAAVALIRLRQAEVGRIIGAEILKSQPGFIQALEKLEAVRRCVAVALCDRIPGHQDLDAVEIKAVVHSRYPHFFLIFSICFFAASFDTFFTASGLIEFSITYKCLSVNTRRIFS